MPETALSAAAERNKEPIAAQLRDLLPAGAKVLEIASGGGQHVVHFAASMPDRHWQPSERGDAELAAIQERIAACGCANIAPPAQLDVLDRHWPVPRHFDAVLCINMIHISPWEATAALFDGAARHLAAGGPGLVITYGAYREDGRHSAPSNEQFDQWLRGLDPRFGVRDIEAVDAVAAARGFTRFHLARMPANNLLLAWRRG